MYVYLYTERLVILVHRQTILSLQQVPVFILKHTTLRFVSSSRDHDLRLQLKFTFFIITHHDITDKYILRISHSHKNIIGYRTVTWTPNYSLCASYLSGISCRGRIRGQRRHICVTALHRLLCTGAVVDAAYDLGADQGTLGHDTLHTHHVTKETRRQGPWSNVLGAKAICTKDVKLVQYT